ARCLEASSTVSAAPPLGSVSAPVGLRIADLAEPPISSAPTSPSSDGPAMSERTAFGADHATHGRRKNVVGEKTFDFMAAMIFCWLRSRLRSLNAGLQR